MKKYCHIRPLCPKKILQIKILIILVNPQQESSVESSLSTALEAYDITPVPINESSSRLVPPPNSLAQSGQPISPLHLESHGPSCWTQRLSTLVKSIAARPGPSILVRPISATLPGPDPFALVPI